MTEIFPGSESDQQPQATADPSAVGESGAGVPSPTQPAPETPPEDAWSRLFGELNAIRNRLDSHEAALAAVGNPPAQTPSESPAEAPAEAEPPEVADTVTVKPGATPHTVAADLGHPGEWPVLLLENADQAPDLDNTQEHLENCADHAQHLFSALLNKWHAGMELRIPPAWLEGDQAPAPPQPCPRCHSTGIEPGSARPKAGQMIGAPCKLCDGAGVVEKVPA